MPKPSHLLTEVEYLISSAPDQRPNQVVATKAVYEAVNKQIPTSHSHRALACALVGQVFHRAVKLIGLGQYPSAYVELHAILEELSIVLLAKQVKDKGQQEIISDLLKRKTLSDVAPYYVRLGYWSASDLTFVKSIAAIRNGVAHRNFALLAKHLPQTKEGRDLDSFRFNLPKSSEALAHTLRLMIQIARPNKRVRK